MLDAISAEEQLYGAEKGWPEHIAQQRELLRIGYEADKFSLQDLAGKAKWTLLGSYLQSDPALDSSHKKVVRRFTYGPWRQYSEISHVTFRGVHELFVFLNTYDAPHAQREPILERAERELTAHLGRSAAVLLALITEIQATFKFDGHNINSRLHEMWRSIVNFPEGEEMFTLRYKDLMEDNGIGDTATVPI
jgi:hypothetical protein